MITLMGNALWHLVAQSDTISKLVLLSLLIMSIACWAVFFYKLSLVRLKRRQMQQAIAHLKTATTLDQVLTITGTLQSTMPGYFLSKNLSYLKGILEINKERGQTALTEQQWTLIQQTMADTIDDMVHHEESYMSFLSTTFTVSPLLGLFGTVWGLIHAFIGISEKQSADIATVAPGIAEALITTLAGIMVAIPALVMFNYLAVQIRSLENQLFALGDKVSDLQQRLFVR